MCQNEVQVKLEMLDQIFVSNSTVTYFRPSFLNIMGVIGNSLSIEDLQVFIDYNVFVSIMFSPGTNIRTRHAIPVNSGFVVVDYNYLKNITAEQAVAILYHEIGHALTPELINEEESEIAADNYAISKGFGPALRESLSFNLENDAETYDKPITHTRIQNINEQL